MIAPEGNRDGPRRFVPAGARALRTAAILGIAAGCALAAAVVWGSFSSSPSPEGNSIAAAAVDHLTISPSSSSISPGHSQTYTVHALGVAPGNTDFGDVTSSSTFSVTSGASCAEATCTSNTTGTYTVTAHYWGLTVNATLSVSTAAAAKLVFTTQPGSDGQSVAGSELSVPPAVTVEDQFGNTVTTDSSTVTLSITSGTPASGGPGALMGCSENESSGVVTFSGCEINAAGSGYELHAIDGGLTAADSAGFSVGTASPDLTISNPTPPSTGTAGSTIGPNSITADIDQSSGTNDAQTVTFTVFGPQTSAPTTCGSGGTTVGTATPAGDGSYQPNAGFTPSQQGDYWWYVSSPADPNNDPAASVCGSSMAETVVGTASPALTMSNPNPPATGTAGTAIPASSIQAILSGSSGSNDMQALTFTVFGPQATAPTSCASGGSTVGTATPSGDGAYHSSSAFTATTAGNYWWQVTSPSDANNQAAASSCGSNMAETAVASAVGSRLVFTSNPQTTTTGISTGTITVQRQDRYGNAATNGSVTVNLTSSSGAGIFRNTSDSATITSVVIGSGASTASFLYRDSNVGTPTISAADAAGVLSTGSQQETVTASAPHFVFTTSSVSGIASSTANLGSITVQRQDILDNPVTAGITTVNLGSSSSGTTVFSLSPGGSPVTSVSIPSGQSSATFYYGDTLSGSPALSVTDAGNMYSTASQQETVSPAPASQLVYTSAPQSLVTGQLSSPITLQRRDQFGNAVTSGSLVVNLTTSSVSGEFLDGTGTTVVTSVSIASGLSTGSFTYKDSSGTAALQASVQDGYVSGATQAETVAKAGTQTSVTTSLSQAEPNQLVQYTATASPSAPASGAPTGSIEFLDDGSPIAACGGAGGEPVNASAVAVCQTAPASGAHTVTAQYLGDSNFSSSAVSPSTSVTVVTPALTLSSRSSAGWTTVGTWTSTPSGSITTAANTCSVSGSNTKFTTELTVGTQLFTGTTKIGTVASIQSDTALTMSGTTCSHSAYTGIAYSARRVPLATDAVIITGGNRVTIPSGATAVAASVSLNPAGASSSTQLTLTASSSTLKVGGDVSLYLSAGTTAQDTNLSVAAGTVSVGGSLHFYGISNDSLQCSLTSVTAGTLSVAGDLTMANTGTATSCATKANFLTPHDMNDIDMSGGAGTLNLGGALSITNPGNSTVRLASNASSSFNFDGVAAQTVTIPGSSNWIYSNLNLNNTSVAGATLGGAVAGANVTGNLKVQSGAFSNGGYAIALSASTSFSVANGAMFTLTGTSSMVTGTSITKTFGASSTVAYLGAAQTVSNESYGNLTLGGSGVKTMPSSALTVPGSLSVSGTASVTAGQSFTLGAFAVASGATFNGSSFSITDSGGWSSYGTFAAGTGTVTLTGSGATLAGSNTSFNNLVLSAAISLSDVTGSTVTVNGTLALGASILTTGGNTVVADGPVTRTGAGMTDGYVDGALQEPVSTGSSSPTFAVGSGGEYAPVGLSIAGASAGGVITASSMSGVEPSFSISGMSQTQYISRFWAIRSSGGLTVSSYNATFTFANPGDLVGAPNTSALDVKELTAGAWSSPSSQASTSTTVSGTGFGTTFGFYAAGD